MNTNPKYTHVLYLSDYPLTEQLFKGYVHSHVRYGNGTWSKLFKTEKYYAEQQYRADTLMAIGDLLASHVGHPIEYTIIEDPNARNVSGWRPRLVLYRKHPAEAADDESLSEIVDQMTDQDVERTLHDFTTLRNVDRMNGIPDNAELDETIKLLEKRHEAAHAEE